MNFIQTMMRTPEELIGTYQYNEDFFGPVEDLVKEKILAYDPHYGPYLWNHLLKTSSDLELFMIQEGYSIESASAAAHAFLLHDADKTLQDIEIWRLEQQKRNLTPEQKQERPNHTKMDATVVTRTMTQLGLEMSEDDLKHFMMIRYFTKYHHERLNGTGPHGLSAEACGPILRMAAIVDTVDGKRKAKDLSMIFSEMVGSKHMGEFDEDLVRKYSQLLGTRAPHDQGFVLALANNG